MPPKPRAPRKASTAAKGAALADKEQDAANLASAAMPPPPDPPLILEPEMDALSNCLKNAMVKTGQVYRFFNNTHSLGIHKHAPCPPRSLTASLGREVEKYDQLCDAIESHLLRAISVLQRDVSREQQRIVDAKTASISTRTRSKSTSRSPTSTRIPLPPVTGSSGSASGVESSPELPLAGTQASPTISPTSSIPPGRRPSAISLSSLHRPPFPHKLDLSSTALRISTEEATLFQSGLASPVTLAPKSARPTSTSEYPPDLMTAFEVDTNSNRPVDIDLTLPDTEMASANVRSSGDVAMDLGDSADKPIELDLEAMDIDNIDMSNMTDLFGDSMEENANEPAVALFSPSTPVSAGNAVKGGNSLSMELLDALSGGVNNDLFTFGSTNSQNTQPADQAQPSSSQHTTVPLPSNGLTSHSVAATSPGSILASFTSTSNVEQPASSNNIHVGDVQFDFPSLDLENFSSGFFDNPQGSDMDFRQMEALLNIGENAETKTS